MDSSSHDQTADPQKAAAPQADIGHDEFAADADLDVQSSPDPDSPTPVETTHIDTSFPVDNTIRPEEQTPSGQSVSSWSAASDRQLGHGSQADPGDRVFPIRSVVSVDPTPRSSTDQDYFPRMSADSSGFAAARPSHPTRPDTETYTQRRGSVKSDSVLSPPAGTSSNYNVPEAVRRRMNNAGVWSSVQADAERQGSHPLPIFANEASSDGDEEPASTDPPSAPQSTAAGTPGLADTPVEGHMTTRFKHVTTDDGHLLITGRDGTLQRCEDEAIHTPGAVQAFGLLLAIREEADGRFTVRYASENSKRIIGYTPLELFRLTNFTDILTEEQADNLLDHVDFIRDEDADPAINGPEVFSMSIRPPKKRTVKLWCAIHIHPAHPDLTICEFELDDDHDFPLRPDDERTPDIPADTLRGNPTMEELAESTEITSKPLRVLRSARKRRGEAGAMQVFDIMSQVQEQLASAPNLEQFLKVLVGIVKELTGFHRVMVYQFDNSFNGKVVTELVDPVVSVSHGNPRMTTS